MSDPASFDINITLSDVAQGWQPHLMQSSWSATEDISQHDEFDLDVKYDEIVGDPPTKGPLLGLSGPFGITCSNTCGIASGCAGSGCGGITCGNSCNVFSGCASACGTCGQNTCAGTCAQTACGTCGDTCGGTCDDDCGG
jgi:hypothetical protein